jgi:hypothetical protein
MRVVGRLFLSSMVLALVGGGEPVIAAGLRVGNGAAVDLGSGRVDLNCLNLETAGRFAVGAGSVSGADSVSIQPTGELDGGSGTIQLTGDWTNAGSFAPGQSGVRIEDGCGIGVSAVSGDNEFAGFSAVTTTGKTISVAADSLQTFSNLVRLQGEAPAGRLRIRSSIDGQPVYFVLFEQGAQHIEAVDVKDNDASGGQLLVPGTPEQFASVDAGNNRNWFSQILDLIFRNGFESD